MKKTCSSKLMGKVKDLQVLGRQTGNKKLQKTAADISKMVRTVPACRVLESLKRAKRCLWCSKSTYNIDELCSDDHRRKYRKYVESVAKIALEAK